MMKVNSKIQETNHRSPLFHLMYHRDDVEFSIHDCVLEILSLPFLSKRCGRSAVFDAAFLALAVEPTSARLPSCSAFRASATRKTAGAEPKRCGLRRLWACRTEEESEWEHRNGMVWWENGGWWEKPVRFWYRYVSRGLAVLACLLEVVSVSECQCQQVGRYIYPYSLPYDN
ncbi:uncharacterized protein LOC124364567 isoform X2 [Homalodisca vitripennis]|uniref:uncharacterized protein LOC124364567 isoform X2 n=1 Tax=Homalodisca vitripennis TaxID=197043 RepID=UPI001EEC395A|nr:uncharacterized protein LOC124364567 isoform X2 [Homalodisca vitripennis]